MSAGQKGPDPMLARRSCGGCTRANPGRALDNKRVCQPNRDVRRSLPFEAAGTTAMTRHDIVVARGSGAVPSDAEWNRGDPIIELDNSLAAMEHNPSSEVLAQFVA